MSQPDELETRLRRAMHTEADATPVSPDALVRIRGRIAPPKSKTSVGWLRPAVAASGLAFTLVVGTLAGVKIAGDGGDANVAEPPSVLFDPAATGGPDDSGDAESSSKVPAVTPTPEYLPNFGPDSTGPVGASTADPLSALSGPTDRTHKVPVDTGGPYVSITGPDSGVTVVGRMVELSGQARTFEANVVIEVTQNGKVVKRESTTATSAGPELGDWTKVLALEPGAYRIDAFEESMQGNGTRTASDTIWITVAAEPQDATGPDDEVTPTPGADPAPGEESEPGTTGGATTGGATTGAQSGTEPGTESGTGSEPEPGSDGTAQPPPTTPGPLP